MKSPSTPRPVIVASDGSPAALLGVEYAALEARQRRTALDIVHVTPMYVPVGPLPMLPDGSLQEFGRDALDVSCATAAATADVEVRTHLLAGGRIAALVEAAGHAAVLVLGSRSLSRGARIWTGATVVGVVARARCPVVVVPEGWQARDPGRMSRVLVGLKSTQRARPLLRTAFNLAHNRGAELRILHAWKLPAGYDDVVANADAALDWGQAQRDLITPLIADLRTEFPDVPVSIEVLHERPADALVEASTHADRLLLTKPVHGGRVHHLGAVARGVLRSARCPVEVVSPMSVDTTEDDLVLEDGGRLQRQ